ncbi:unnamed protein product [Didymodactylos carnosus]|uniref:Uncharacterized protein n=1 Tax=Didymodactylos carnosus TaxID=1234261 RepID=A0A815PIG4_9BILA|nr:unnamed protein product [Didymodactylos carnosus]CAF1641619.1 unnamed protein product [Didymodactylos carnosus]CAF4323387.1 unnamed protein product [Didymodactylos carnosus]CAF4478537.1 unnamed protein product [Didymodactylos carnosus]
MQQLDDLINFETDDQSQLTEPGPSSSTITVSNALCSSPLSVDRPFSLHTNLLTLSAIFSSTECPSSSADLVPPSRHKQVRKRAEENYLETAYKNRAKYDQHLSESAKKFNIGDRIGIKIDNVDRTNTDPKIWPCLIISKEKKRTKFRFQGSMSVWKLDEFIFGRIIG